MDEEDVFALDVVEGLREKGVEIGVGGGFDGVEGHRLGFEFDRFGTLAEGFDLLVELIGVEEFVDLDAERNSAGLAGGEEGVVSAVDFSGAGLADEVGGGGVLGDAGANVGEGGEPRRFGGFDIGVTFRGHRHGGFEGEGAGGLLNLVLLEEGGAEGGVVVGGPTDFAGGGEVDFELVGEAENDGEVGGVDAEEGLVEIEPEAAVEGLGEAGGDAGEGSGIDVIRPEHGEVDFFSLGESGEKGEALFVGEGGEDWDVDGFGIRGEVGE